MPTFTFKSSLRAASMITFSLVHRVIRPQHSSSKTSIQTEMYAVAAIFLVNGK